MKKVNDFLKLTPIDRLNELKEIIKFLEREETFYLGINLICKTFDFTYQKTSLRCVSIICNLEDDNTIDLFVDEIRRIRHIVNKINNFVQPETFTIYANRYESKIEITCKIQQ